MQPVVIGIAGGSGSGKTTLVDAVSLAAPLPVSMLPFDNYYRDQRDVPFEARERVNYDHPNALDIDRFAEDLAILRSGRPLAAPTYDFARHTRSDAVHLVEPTPIVIVDGILLLVFDEICELLDVRVFVDVPEEIRIARRLERDVAERGRTREYAIAQIDRTVRPMHGEFVQPSADRAHLVIDGTSCPHASAQLVLEHLPTAVTVR